MTKIAFKNPTGGTIYWATTGFDWGAFWSFFLLGGLPFFLRKMNIWGAFCLAFMFSNTVEIGFETINWALEPIDFEGYETLTDYALGFFLYFLTPLLLCFFTLSVSLYLGFKGGKLTARHYIEEGYTIHTKDKSLLAFAKNKWDFV
ncbi:MAG: hypothetical protein JSR85_02695 [Proteobacteria bacterium]|nr:hypothetical protein [Pseudomonadota bacterium]